MNAIASRRRALRALERISVIRDRLVREADLIERNTGMGWPIEAATALREAKDRIAEAEDMLAEAFGV